MADQFDRASDLEELERQSALALQQKRSVPVAYATGYCLYCEESLEGNKRWCDTHCRDDWEQLEKTKG